MKARTESNHESVYENNSFERVAIIPTKPKPNKEPQNKARTDNGNKQINGYCGNGVSRDYSERSVQKENLKPLHFDTQEALDETPQIFRSLNSNARGPETFVYLSPLKPSSLFQNEDPCKTFVISSENNTFVNIKNSLNQTSVMNGFGSKINSTSDNENEYLSYVIEKRNGEMTEVGGDVEEENVGPSAGEVGHARTTQDEAGKPDGGPQCEERNEATLSFDKTIAGKKEQAFAKLQDELQKAHLELKLKDEEVARLTRIREDVERELEELTASLFQEAHKMVSVAKEKQAAAEKSLQESQMKVDVLTAEVVALKTLVLTSTPSRPNPHLHPQIGKEESAGGVNLFNRKHRRSPSHFNLKYGRENSPPESPVRDKGAVQNASPSSMDNRDMSEVDPTVHKEFLNWNINCKLDKTDPFIDRIYREDINLCLDFSNRELAEEVQNAIENRNIFIEAVTDKSKTIFPRSDRHSLSFISHESIGDSKMLQLTRAHCQRLRKWKLRKCALLEVTKQCHYRMRLGDQDVWYNISQMCRNRIIAVCDFINYLRYIELGLVKSSTHDIYWEIMRLRKEMILARLGLSSPSS